MDDETQSGTDVGTWGMARLGYAIDTYVDRQINTPQVMSNGAAYGMDSNGNLYKVGQPTTVQTVSPVSGANGSSLLLIVLVLAYVASHHGK
jgi:hypothetical protein